MKKKQFFQRGSPSQWRPLNLGRPGGQECSKIALYKDGAKSGEEASVKQIKTGSTCVHFISFVCATLLLCLARRAEC